MRFAPPDLQPLEHEKGGVKIYETALKCVVNEDLKEAAQCVACECVVLAETTITRTGS